MSGKILREVDGPAKSGLNRALVESRRRRRRAAAAGAVAARAPAVAPLTVGDYTVTVDVAGQSLSKPAKVRERLPRTY